MTALSSGVAAIMLRRVYRRRPWGMGCGKRYLLDIEGEGRGTDLTREK